jgi:uncharacterized membrane protein
LTVEQSWAGPLPAPSVLGQYEQILPGAAERILMMAETAATGEIRILEKQSDAEIEAAKRGQLLAAGLTVCAMIGSAGFFAVGNTVAGVAFLSLPLLLLIRSFITTS